MVDFVIYRENWTPTQKVVLFFVIFTLASWCGFHAPKQDVAEAQTNQKVEQHGANHNLIYR